MKISPTCCSFDLTATPSPLSPPLFRWALMLPAFAFLLSIPSLPHFVLTLHDIRWCWQLVHTHIVVQGRCIYRFYTSPWGLNYPRPNFYEPCSCGPLCGAPALAWAGRRREFCLREASWTGEDWVGGTTGYEAGPGRGQEGSWNRPEKARECISGEHYGMEGPQRRKTKDPYFTFWGSAVLSFCTVHVSHTFISSHSPKLNYHKVEGGFQWGRIATGTVQYLRWYWFYTIE